MVVSCKSRFLAVGAKHLRPDLSVKSGFLSANASPFSDLFLSIDSRTISLGHWIMGKTVDWSADRMVILVSDDANTQVVGRESPKVG